MSIGIKAVLALILGISSVFLVFLTVLKRHGFSSFILCSLQGICALFAVNILGFASGIQLPVTPFSLGVSAFLGAPGVITMLLMDVI